MNFLLWEVKINHVIGQLFRLPKLADFIVESDQGSPVVHEMKGEAGSRAQRISCSDSRCPDAGPPRMFLIGR